MSNEKRDLTLSRDGMERIEELWRVASTSDLEWLEAHRAFVERAYEFMPALLAMALRTEQAEKERDALKEEVARLKREREG